MGNTFTDNYCKWTEQFTDAPPQFHRYIAYWVLGTCLGRRVWMRMGDDQLFPNIWLVILAPSSFYRKSTCLSIGARIVAHENPDILLPSEWTREGLISLLQKQPQAAMISYEFKSLLSLLQRDYNAGAQSILTELYDCPEYYIRKTGVDPIREFRVQFPFLSILAASTMDWLLDAVKGKDVSGGFLARFIFVSANKKEKSYAIQPQADPFLKSCVYNALKTFAYEGQMEYTEDARQFYEDWYFKFASQCDKQHESIRAFFPRLTTYAHKFAILEAVMHRREPNIALEDVQKACLIADNLAAEVVKLEGESLGQTIAEKNRNKILRLITQTPGIEKRILLQNCHLLSRQFKEIMDTLLETGQVRFEKNGFFLGVEKEAKVL